jgi:hypothetical protein
MGKPGISTEQKQKLEALAFVPDMTFGRSAYEAGVSLSLPKTISGSIHDEARRGSASRQCYRTAE